MVKKINLWDHARVVNLYLCGHSSTELCKEFGVNSQTILNLLKYYKIKIRDSKCKYVKAEYKECTKCHKLLLHTDAFFRKKGISKCGMVKLRSDCRQCELKSNNVYQKTRKFTDINFKIRKSYSSRIRRAFSFSGRKKAKVTSDMLGCTIVDLKRHIESKFTDGMSWDNYGDWHIDHIKPCSLFDLSQKLEQLECFHYSNLQPLWKEDNFKKGNKYQVL